ncbi:hypothetical protein GCM10028857_24250 [Salinarchaeum chitinilyticum]
MGEHARRIQERLAEGLTAERPDAAWSVEHRVGGTPVDVAGETDERLMLVELEWRRADPANNTAKLFRHLAEGGALREELDGRDAVVIQVFTRHYELQDGSPSSKRRDATFVGAAAAEYLDDVRYRAITLDVEPPKAGGDLPEGWTDAVDAAVESVRECVDEGNGGSDRR